MASLPMEFHPDARIDAIEAYDWYAKRSREAADSFQEELQDAGLYAEFVPHSVRGTMALNAAAPPFDDDHACRRLAQSTRQQQTIPHDLASLAAWRETVSPRTEDK